MSAALKPARPDLRVIDRAIELVDSGRERWTCWALALAVDPAAKRPVNAYTAQFRMHMSRDGGLPKWWTEGPNDWHHRALRVAALKSFRQACIDAAKTIPSQDT